jgi:putative endonuclease
MLRLLLDSLRGLAARRLPAHLRSGRRGEDIAYRHLSDLGYRIVARNYRSRATKGETDLIGWDGDYLAFIEVKTRAGETFGRPEDAVDSAKRRHLIRAAKDYIRRAGVDHNRMRFDIVSVILDGKKPQVRLLKGAFIDRDVPWSPGCFR